MIDVFLSASVPLPERDRRFFETADVLAIREAIKALVEVVLPVGRITCGGHPAITPLLALFVREAGVTRDHLTVYQSAFFQGAFPGENDQFTNVVIVPTVSNDREKSLLAMRRQMIRSRQFAAGVFIGGMEGVLAEARLISEIHPGTALLPIASTGAAARELFDSGEYPQEAANELPPSLPPRGRCLDRLDHVGRERRPRRSGPARRFRLRGERSRSSRGSPPPPLRHYDRSALRGLKKRGMET
jgi:hypothetical protein